MQSMNIYAPRGTKLKVLLDEKGDIKNGYDHEKDDIDRYLDINAVYTLEDSDIGNWCTHIMLKEFPGKRFNSVCFYEVPDIK